MNDILATTRSESNRTLLMGVLNVTPDSFSDGGIYTGVAEAVDRGMALWDAGADVVDVGGESTRPGAEPVDAAEELGRVLPVIEGLARARPQGVISIDTTKAAVAARALDAGARWVNDISGGTFEPELLRVVADRAATLVLGHTRGRPSSMQDGSWTYRGGVVRAVRQGLRASATRALDAGVGPSRIWVDPGIGFGKTLDENLELLRHLGNLRTLGFPVLVGTSRKRFIGRLTGRAPAERAFGTAATVALSIQAGAEGVRVHDVEAIHDVIQVSDAWVRGIVPAEPSPAASEPPPLTPAPVGPTDGGTDR
ncbi:MAG TPA: dihydropteroate synthase [Myxococcales bacterium LLY-WYZ-16_1]|nr:dihydropteroate synthase [Myxococcales bacterium LLY-WYZ-16_1]